MGLITDLTGVLTGVLTVLGANGPASTGPSNEGFYQLPPGYESAAPGTILKYQKTPFVLSDPLPRATSDAYQVMFRTIDSFGEPAGGVTTILIPNEPDYSKILAYLSIHDSAAQNCSPSYTMEQGSLQDDVAGRAIDEAQHLFMAAALNQGWIVTVPDYEGLNAAFLANRKSAYVTLDALRATRASSNFTGISPDAQATVWGYSGASMVSALTAEFQESYAPELTILGAAMGGTVPDIQSALKMVNKAPNACLIPMGMYGLANEYTELGSIIEEQLVDDPAKKAKFRNARSICLGKGFVDYPFQDMHTYFKDPDFIDNNTYAQKIYYDNRLLQHTTKIPFLIYKALFDATSLSPETDQLVTQYCDAGVNVDYRRLVAGGHFTLGLTGMPEAMGWLKDRMNGIPAPPKCSRSNHLSALADPTSLDFAGDYVAAKLWKLLHAVEKLDLQEILS